MCTHRLAHPGKIAQGLSIAGTAVGMWAIIWPQPYALLIASLAALPVLVVVFAVLGIVSADSRTTIGPCLLPAIAVMVRMLLDVNLVSWTPLIVVAAAGAILFVAILAIGNAGMRKRPWTLLVCGLLTAAYGFGVVGEANTLLDLSQAALHRPQVLGKSVHYGTGRGNYTHYHVRLSPWGPRSEPNTVEVPREIYDGLLRDGPACVLLHPGALGMPWFTVDSCH